MSTTTLLGLFRVAVAQDAPEKPILSGPIVTHRLLSSSFLGFPCRILNIINHKQELLFLYGILYMNHEL